MKHALHIYSDILILRDGTYRALKRSPGAPAYVVLMFLAVTLVAGAGKWLALPHALSRPTFAAVIDRASEQVTFLDEQVVPSVQSALDSVTQDNLRTTLADVLPPTVTATAETLANVVNRAGLTSQQLIDLIETTADVPDAVAAELANRPPTADVVRQLLRAAALEPDQLRTILATAALGNAPSVVSEAGGITSVLAGTLLSRVSDRTGLQGLLTTVALTADRMRTIATSLGLDPVTVSRLNARIGAVPQQLQDTLDIAHRELEVVQPPLGTGVSRFIHFVGDWLSTPFQVAAAYLPLSLVALLVAKMLGGKGTVAQHLFGTALAAAPAFLLFLTFTGDLGNAIALSTQYAIGVAGRILGLIGFAWAFLILIKSLSVAHEFSPWRSAATIGLTYVAIYILVPVLSFLALGYLLRG